VGRWTVTKFEPTDRSILAICGQPGDIIEFTARGDFIVKPPPQTGRHTKKERFKCVTSHKPPWIDLYDSKFRDMRCVGLYQLNGDELLLCTGEIRQPRPDRLVRRKKSWVVNVMRRLTKQ
jgi:uncharacterized protein (TIGR03067 family)